MPRFKRDVNALPSAIALYPIHDIEQAIPGGDHHTFVRDIPDAPAVDTAQTTAIVPDEHEHSGRQDAGTSITVEPTSGKLQPSLRSTVVPSENFCRIMIHKNAHLTPPKELWTRNNTDQLDANVGRPLPVFQEAHGRQFEFLGWYRVVKWDLCAGGGAQVRRFIERRRLSQKERSVEYWAKAFGESWARVELDRVRDGSLPNPMLKETN